MPFSWKQLPDYPVSVDERGEYSPNGRAKTSGVVPLASEGLLTIDGSDALKFLQGQMTCDFQELKGNRFSMGGCCTPKGRMISSFMAYRWPESDRFTLRMHRPLVDILKNHLHKYSVFFKAKMLDQTDAYFRLGLYGPDLAERFQAMDIPLPEEEYQAVAWGDQGIVLRWDADLVEIWLSTEAEQHLKAILDDFGGWTATEIWQARWIELGLGEVREASQEHFIPQMLNLQHTGGISFTKGCYTGQEIVARLQHRGTIKRALYPFQCTTDSRPEDGTAIISSSKATSVGEVLMSGVNEEGMVVLSAVVEKQYLNAGLTLENGSLLTLKKLPYALEGE